jgi:hypothetical protein
LGFHWTVLSQNISGHPVGKVKLTLPVNRVTEFGKFLPFGRVFSFGNFVRKFHKYPNVWVKGKVTILKKKCIGLHFGRFFTKASGHPAGQLRSTYRSRPMTLFSRQRFDAFFCGQGQPNFASKV